MTEQELADLEAKTRAALPPDPERPYMVNMLGAMAFEEAANPQAILALIADVRRLRGLLGEAFEYTEHASGCAGAFPGWEGEACPCGRNELDSRIARELEGKT